MIRTIHHSDAANSYGQLTSKYFVFGTLKDFGKHEGEIRDVAQDDEFYELPLFIRNDRVIISKSIHSSIAQSISTHLASAGVFMLKFTNEMFAGADVARGNFIFSFSNEI
jgi:hypothetical protein